MTLPCTALHGPATSSLQAATFTAHSTRSKYRALEDTTVLQTGSCRLPQEVSILKGLNYDRNIVQFYGACIQEGTDPMLVVEYMEGGCFRLPASTCCSYPEYSAAGDQTMACSTACNRAADARTGLTLTPTKHVVCCSCCRAGGDLCTAIAGDDFGELQWYNRGHQIALDIARGLYFLHSHDVSTPYKPLCPASAPSQPPQLSLPSSG
jgi:serine/threonine protein kinase